MPQSVTAFEVFGLRWVSPATATAMYGWITGSAKAPHAWEQRGKALVVTQWEQTIDSMKAPKTADVAAVAAAVGEGILSIIPGGAVVAASLAAPIALGIAALRAADAVAAALLPDDAMLYPTNWWRLAWPETVASPGRFICLSGSIPDGEGVPGCAVVPWEDIETVAGRGQGWAVWLSAPDAWLSWCASKVAIEKARRGLT
jgi:hypothetical protein